MIRIDIIASGSKGNCNVLYDGKIAYVLDCGVPIKIVRQYFFEKGRLDIFNAINYVIISHKHGDHESAFKEWGERIGYEYILQDYNNENPVEITIGSFLFKPFYVAHDVINYGYIISSNDHKFNICWFTDASDIPKIKLPIPIDIFLIEANHTEYQLELANSYDKNRGFNYRRHMSIEKITQWLMNHNLSQTQVIHFLHITTNRQIDHNIWATTKNSFSISNHVIKYAKEIIGQCYPHIVIKAIEPFPYIKTNKIKDNLNKGQTYEWK